ncbi:hypothetical protein [Ktedonobacter robiniae]|nr:hypothetical protein [Ktedonobacter robiniae]
MNIHSSFQIEQRKGETTCTLETIRKRIAAYEAAGVQELQIIFPDAVQLDSRRRFAQAFIA